ncbi:transposase [Paenibacillus pectinilyticus]|uniref:Transposase n=1 Tax=Paenibacillus pectinilyticus TaxID=512399 RepID=A0A1C0ZYI5_9BACL|nr:RNA-guided endonuclease TnpB family protein [Paenibacillus pectinilyticus]OCT13166.1 transposase [Paenibacillus pectinilyticus]
MILAKKVRLLPTPEQQHQLWKSVGTARWAYNWTLSRQRENYEKSGKFLFDGELRKELTVLKQTEEYFWLYEVSNNVVKQAVKDACDAFKRFFKKQASFPQFKSKRKSKPAFYNDNVKLKIKDDLVLIEKVGWVETVESLPMNTNYTQPRVSFDGKYWYLSVGFEERLTKVELTNVVLGIDVGVKEFAVRSDGIKHENINKTKTVRKTKKRLGRLQRSVSRKYQNNKEGSRFVKTSNIIKQEKQIRLLHRKLANIRNNQIHQVTNSIVKTKPLKVVIENLNVSGMMKNKHLSKAIAEQKLHDFKVKLFYKCEKYGIELVEADRWYPSSKLCSRCGALKKNLKLSERTYNCSCGLRIDRDLNASINLANYGLQLAI